MKKSQTGGSLRSLDSCSSSDLDSDALAKVSDMGLRSPGAAVTSGRSVKEIDEQLTNLRKENFNLKLRIYFLEERMGANFNTDKEDAIKKNIELMVELENVRRDLEDKQELLCQAAKAMEIEEEEKKKEMLTRDQEIVELKEALEDVKSQLQSAMQRNEENKELGLCAEAFDLNLKENNNTADIVKKLQDTIKNLQVELSKERERADHFENIIELAESAHVRCKNLETEVEDRESKLNNLTSELEETGSKMMSFNQRIEALEEELNEKTTQLQNTVVELRQKDRELKEQQTEIQELNKLCIAAQQQSEKNERKVEKYKTLLLQSENKNHEMLNYIDTLKNKIQNLEIRLEAALDEVKKSNSKTETVISTDQKAKSNNTDVALFSVRNPLSVCETPKSSSKSSPKINRSPKSIHSKSPSKSTMSIKSQSNIDSHSQEVPESKSVTPTEISSEMHLSNDELLELKKNHYKACKMIKAMIQRKSEYVEQIEKLQALVVEKGSEIENLQTKIVELTESNNALVAGQKKKSIQELVSELNLTASSNPAANKENSMAGDEMHLTEQYKELVNELETKIEILQATLSEKDSQLEHVRLDLQLKANRIIDLEFEVLALTQGINDRVDLSSDKEETVEKLLQEKEEKEKEIQRLDGELKQRTGHLQGLVNKELWEKNRAIEKMQTVLKEKREEINKLQKNVYGKDLQLQILKDKINELGIHVNLPPGLIAADSRASPSSCGDVRCSQEQWNMYVEERKHFLNEIEILQKKLNNIPEHDENKKLAQLQAEYKDLQDELEKSEKLRQESQEICSVLSIRLDELCCFLRSLLKQKSVLGFLGTEQANKLQEVIDKSLDLSRTLSATMTLNPDQSLLQLSNITNLLNATRNDSFNLSEFFTHDEENNAVLSIIPSDITLTYQSHLHKSLNCSNEQVEVIKVLREQIQDLKREIQLRDVELEKRLINEQGEKPLENDEEFVDALVELQPNSSPQLDSPGNVYRSLIEEATKLNTTSSTIVAEKLTLNTTSTTLKNLNENHSESESWSEPDRTVSMARIGLQDESLKRPSINSLTARRARFVSGSNMSTESTEDDQLHNISRTPSKRSSLAETRQTILALHEQVCSLEVKLKEKENQLLAAQVAFYETDNLLKQEQVKMEKARQENVELVTQVADATKKLDEVEQQKFKLELKMKEAENEHAKLIKQIKETNSKLEEAEKRKASAEEKISELQTIVAVLEGFKQNVEKTIDTKNKEMQNILNEMEVEKMKALGAAQDAEKLLKNAQNDLHSMQTELANMEKREQKLRDDLEKEYKQSLKKIEEQYALNLRSAEQEYEVQARKCREAVVQIRENYEKEYIKKSEVDRRTLEVEEITKEVGKLQGVIYDCEIKMNAMEKRELELKNKVLELQQEHQQKINDLHKELDSATLQYSEAILEKTKLQNETSTLEQKVQKFYAKENELIKEVNKLHKEYQETQANLQSQITQLESKRSFMELKISNLEAINAELQSVNAELRNRLVKIQIGRNITDVITSTSLPNNPGKILDLHPNKTLPISIKGFCHYSRELSDHSGYTSEDIPIEEGGLRDASNAMHTQNISGLADVDHERVHASSSPDLGIESDHGRFSSLEANVTIPRPLLPTLELTQSMSNLLDPVQDVSCANDQCCKKSIEVAQENVELRKRLLRTRRALEETLNRLTLANKQKKEVEKSICKQIVKTSQVLRKAKANLDSGSETDLLKK